LIDDVVEKIVNWRTRRHVACGQENVNLYSGATMDDSMRREERNDSERQRASHTDEEERDELAERREQARQRQALTPREREDRWPIG
jgi:hypothetical protein